MVQLRTTPAFNCQACPQSAHTPLYDSILEPEFISWVLVLHPRLLTTVAIINEGGGQQLWFMSSVGTPETAIVAGSCACAAQFARKESASSSGTAVHVC